MSNQQDTKMKGLLVGMSIAGMFGKDYKAILEKYEPDMQLVITAHLEQILSIYQEDPENGNKKIYDAEKVLSEKYGPVIKPYIDMQFYKYFDTEILLSEKEILSVEEWKIFYSGKKRISPEDMAEFVNIAINDVGLSRRFMSIGRDLKDLYAEKEKYEKENPRQLLAIYFILKAQSIENHVEDTAMAKFIHLLSNIPFTSIENSDIYKKYREMPYYKKDKELLADLKYIRPFFEETALNDVVALIDSEIAKLEK